MTSAFGGQRSIQLSYGCRSGWKGEARVASTTNHVSGLLAQLAGRINDFLASRSSFLALSQLSAHRQRKTAGVKAGRFSVGVTGWLSSRPGNLPCKRCRSGPGSGTGRARWPRRAGRQRHRR